MQFINIVVHSVEDMNFRVHLQYEFTQLNLDDYLEKLRHHESEELQVDTFVRVLSVLTFLQHCLNINVFLYIIVIN